MNPEHVYLGQRFKSHFKGDAEWFEFYGEVKEEIPFDTTFPYGKDVEINAWVDADHA